MSTRGPKKVIESIEDGRKYFGDHLAEAIESEVQKDLKASLDTHIKNVKLFLLEKLRKETDLKWGVSAGEREEAIIDVYFNNKKVPSQIEKAVKIYEGQKQKQEEQAKKRREKNIESVMQKKGELPDLNLERNKQRTEQLAREAEVSRQEPEKETQAKTAATQQTRKAAEPKVVLHAAPVIREDRFAKPKSSGELMDELTGGEEDAISKEMFSEATEQPAAERKPIDASQKEAERQQKTAQVQKEVAEAEKREAQKHAREAAEKRQKHEREAAEKRAQKEQESLKQKKETAEYLITHKTQIATDATYPEYAEEQAQKLVSSAAKRAKGPLTDKEKRYRQDQQNAKKASVENRKKELDKALKDNTHPFNAEIKKLDEYVNSYKNKIVLPGLKLFGYQLISNQRDKLKVATKLRELLVNSRELSKTNPEVLAGHIESAIEINKILTGSEQKQLNSQLVEVLRGIKVKFDTIKPKPRSKQ